MDRACVVRVQLRRWGGRLSSGDPAALTPTTVSAVVMCLPSHVPSGLTESVPRRGRNNSDRSVLTAVFTRWAGSKCPADGRLPNADMGAIGKTIQHIRDIFYRMVRCLPASPPSHSTPLVYFYPPSH
eukprot:5428525-Pyramimonas_sp.AAC.2